MAVARCLAGGNICYMLQFGFSLARTLQLVAYQYGSRDYVFSYC